MKRVTAITTMIVTILISMVFAEVPPRISYQGVLTDGGGGAVPDGDYQITFTIYDDPGAASGLWTETQTVPVIGGIFNVILGQVNPIDIPFDAPYWLGVKVASEPEMTPRRELTTSPYSMTSNMSANVMGVTNVFPSDGSVGIGTTAPDPTHLLHVMGLARFELPTGQFDITTPGGNPGIIALEINGHRRDISFNPEGMYLATSATGNAPSANNGIRILENGNVGIGRNPGQRLDVGGAIRLGNTTGDLDGSIRYTGTDFEGYDGTAWKSLTGGGGGGLPAGTFGQTLRHDGVQWGATSNLYNGGSDVGIGTTLPTATLHVEAASAGANDVALFRNGAVSFENNYNGTHSLSIVNTDPGAQSQERIDFTDENGSVTFIVAKDDDNADGPDLFMQNGRPGGDIVFLANNGIMQVKNDGMVDIGDAIRDGSLKITGSSRSILMDTGLSGDNSVQLPNGAISDMEIYNEPGAVSKTSSGPSITLSGGVDVLLSQTITAPSAGYALVIATGDYTNNHVVGSNSYAIFGVSASNSALPTNQENWEGRGSLSPTNRYEGSVTAHGLFQVNAGSNTFYFLGDGEGGEFIVYTQQLTVVFIPTAYGTVEPTVAGGPTANTQLRKSPRQVERDVATEGTAASADDIARLQRELDELRAEIRELRKQRGQNSED